MMGIIARRKERERGRCRWLSVLWVGYGLMQEHYHSRVLARHTSAYEQIITAPVFA